VIAAPNLSYIPAWIEQAITEAAERDVEIVQTEQGRQDQQGQPPLLTVMADDKRAMVHSDPEAVLDLRADPKRQQLYTTRDDGAIAKLLDRLGLKRLRAPRPRTPLAPKTIAAMLKDALGRLQTELPKTVTPKIEPADETFAIETIGRQSKPESPTIAAKKAAAGIAWERAMSTLLHHLTDQHDELKVIAERWVPPDARIDLDLIVADERKGIAWVIDAKNAEPTNDQLHKMKTQIRLLKDAPEISGGRAIMGVIVHRKGQLQTSLQPTEHHNILRTTIQRLPDLLLAKRLPGQTGARR